MAVLLLVVAVTGNRKHRKDQGEGAEHESLDRADEQLEAIESHEDRRRHSNEECHDEEQDLAGKHVAEETGGEANESRKLGDKLEDADEEIDRITDREELGEVAEPEGADAPPLDEDRGHDCE